jgi:subtilisin family serine protease
MLSHKGLIFGLLALTCAVLPCLGEDSGPTTTIYRFREPRLSGYRVDSAAATGLRLTGAAPAAWVKAWPESGSSNYVEFSSRVVLEIGRSGTLQEVLRGRALTLDRKVSEQVFILQASNVATALREAATLAKDERIIAAYPVTRRPKSRPNSYAAKPNDPFFGPAERVAGEWQANLENRDTNGVPSGVDLNVREAWGVSTGSEVVVAVADDGMELTHPDLRTATQSGPHFSFVSSTENGSHPGTLSYHGTAVAGLIAASANNQRGIAGVAPDARLASWVIFGANDNVVSEEKLMDMFQYRSNVVSVQNHSWGKVGNDQVRLSLLENLAISNAVQHGRSGLGIVMVRAGGNGREVGNDANEDGYLADPRVIAVGAARLDGRVTRYSNPGACILVAAPSGDVKGTTDPCLPDSANLVTTDRQGSRGANRSTASTGAGDYAYGSTGFSGTSAATPQISGLVALVLGANPKLSYRDVQQILVHSSRHYDASDPSLVTNGAGFAVSHNLGFGVPDAGMAVALAKSWSNRPPTQSVTYTSDEMTEIPDLGLQLRIEGPNVPAQIASIAALPGDGPHPRTDTVFRPLVDVGNASSTIEADLRGKVALIQRGPNYFCEKVALAAQAGAELAVIYNNRDGTARIMMAETDRTALTSVFISQEDGEALRDYLLAQPEALGQLTLQAVTRTFDVQENLLCEFVGVRVKTDHTARGDLRIVLTSPAGTQSVLQRVNQDSFPGPGDWTYYSVQHFYESSYGPWTLTVLDENDRGNGSLLEAGLIISGVPLTDSDHDGLDDTWEMQHFGKLAFGPKDDPDHDGFSNAREQIMATNPAADDRPFELQLSLWDDRLARLSWPSVPNATYRVQFGADTVAPLTFSTNVVGQFRQTEWLVPYTALMHQFFQIEAVTDAGAH